MRSTAEPETSVMKVIKSCKRNKMTKNYNFQDKKFSKKIQFIPKNLKNLMQNFKGN